MLTRNQDFILQVFVGVVQYMGNDPHVYSLYFTCKTLYEKFLVKRNNEKGMERYLNLGCLWDIPLQEIEKDKELPNFFRVLFNGYIVCNMCPMYVIFNVCNDYYEIPIPCVRYFYLVKCGNGDVRMRKHTFSYKMNIISVNDGHALANESGLQCRSSMCVGENYLVHHDSFVLGCKFKHKGLMLTSNFFLGEICFFW